MVDKQYTDLDELEQLILDKAADPERTRKDVAKELEITVERVNRVINENTRIYKNRCLLAERALSMAKRDHDYPN